MIRISYTNMSPWRKLDGCRSEVLAAVSKMKGGRNLLAERCGNLGRLLASLTRRRWIVGSTMLIFGLGGYAAIVTLRSDYEIVYGQLMIDGEVRDYRIANPSKKSGGVLPAVFALHGALDTTDQMAAQSGLDALASEGKAVVIYLQGRLLNWPPQIVSENPTQADPDYEFFYRMCALAEDAYSVDPNRIYLVGVSQGGGMVNLVTANCSDRIAAAVCNCGWLPAPLGAEQIATTNKCRMLFIVGEDDAQVPPRVVKDAADAFSRSGHPTTYVVIPGHGHGWRRDWGATDLVWGFLEEGQVSME